MTTDRFQKGFDLNHAFPIKGFRDVRAIAKATIKDKFVGIAVTGDSLKNLGIFHGDLLITKLTHEVHVHQLCIWQTPNGPTAKFAYQDFGKIVLHNKSDWQQSWNTNEIKLIGLVVRIERDLK